MSDIVNEEVMPELSLADLRKKYLAGGPVDPEEYKRVIALLRQDRKAALEANKGKKTNGAAKGRGRAAKSEPVDLMKLFGTASEDAQHVAGGEGSTSPSDESANPDSSDAPAEEDPSTLFEDPPSPETEEAAGSSKT